MLRNRGGKATLNRVKIYFQSIRTNVGQLDRDILGPMAVEGCSRLGTNLNEWFLGKEGKGAIRHCVTSFSCTLVAVQHFSFDLIAKGD